GQTLLRAQRTKQRDGLRPEKRHTDQCRQPPIHFHGFRVPQRGMKTLLNPVGPASRRSGNFRDRRDAGPTNTLAFQQTKGTLEAFWEVSHGTQPYANPATSAGPRWSLDASSCPRGEGSKNTLS